MKFSFRFLFITLIYNIYLSVKEMRAWPSYTVFQLVVSRDIPAKCPQKDQSNHTGQEKNNDKRVENAEPLDFGLRLCVKDVVLQ